MKQRTVLREKPLPKKKRRTLTLPKTHAERAADEIFEETSISLDHDKREVEISLSDDEDAAEASFTSLDYGLDEEDTQNKWEAIAVESADKFRAIFVDFFAMLDGFTAAQEHMNEVMNTKLMFNTNSFLDDLELMLLVKVKSIFLDQLDLEGDERMAAFIKTAIHSRDNGEKAMHNLKKWLNEQIGVQENESDPYGKIAITKSLDRDKK